MKLEKSRIYIAPPDRHLLLDDGGIFLGTGPRENNARPAIDPMFRSVALCCSERAIGAVLTGNLGVGASGLWTLKLSGGLTIVQDPNDAAHSAMPFNAMDQAAPQYVVALRDMPALLGDLVRLPWGKKVEPPASLAAEVAIAKGSLDSMDTMDKIGRRSTLACPECHGVL